MLHVQSQYGGVGSDRLTNSQCLSTNRPNHDDPATTEAILLSNSRYFLHCIRNGDVNSRRVTRYGQAKGLRNRRTTPNKELTGRPECCGLPHTSRLSDWVFAPVTGSTVSSLSLDRDNDSFWRDGAERDNANQRSVVKGAQRKQTWPWTVVMQPRNGRPIGDGSCTQHTMDQRQEEFH